MANVGGGGGGAGKMAVRRGRWWVLGLFLYGLLESWEIPGWALLVLLGGPGVLAWCGRPFLEALLLCAVLGGRSFVPDFALVVISSAALQAGLWKKQKT